ncbi:hypothetical protein SKAU_G00117040 [Synaphobranchus kaupii]|uniref:Coiled-coil domain-containing protein 39 n=1 Tax=Synaphobranchus kaupii TaxID=118154 RepID=A0A9Q1FNJ9_SYNKA|nr:hypothetical protein SKAU_G00117040 [Synaphobranchus kaupii]
MPQKILSEVGFDAPVDNPADGTDDMENEVKNKEKLKEILEGNICKQRESIHMMCDEVKQKRVLKSIEKLERVEGQLTQEVRLDENTANMADFESDVEEKENRVRRARLHSAALVEKLRIESKVAASAERRAEERERALKEEELKSKEMESLYGQHQEALSAKTQELQSLKSRENFLLANISAGQTTVTGLKERQSGNEQEVQIAALERKLQALSEEEDESKERKTLQEEESELAQTLRAKKKAARMLRKQQKNMETELGCGRRAVEKTADSRKELSSKVQEMELDTDASIRELKSLGVKKQDVLRRDFLLRLDVKRVGGHAQSEADRLVAAETRKLQLELAVKELQLENAFKREMHLAKTVITRQDLTKLRAEVNQKLRRADTLRRKYETVATSSFRFQGEVVTLQSYTGRTCKDTELKSRLDLWTQKVCEKQAEVKMLENTLNTHRSQSAVPRATPRSAEDHGKQSLSQEKRALEETCYSKRRKIHKLQQDIKGEKIALDKLLREESLQTCRVDEARSRLQLLKKQLRSQEAKLDCTHQQCSEVTLEVQSAWKPQDKTKKEEQEEEVEEEQEDIKLSKLLDFSREVDRMLLEVMAKQTDLGSVLLAQFQQNNLSLLTPATPPATDREMTCTSASSLGRGSSETPAPSSRGVDSDSNDLTLKLALKIDIVQSEM